MTEEMKKMWDVQAKNTFALHNGMELEAVERDRVVIGMSVSEKSMNPLGIVHGGAMYTMADSAAGLAALTGGRRYATRSSTMHYLSNCSEGTLHAEAQVIHRGRSTCLVKTQVCSEEGKVLAMGEFDFFCVER